MTKLIESLASLRWRFFAGTHSYATRITRFVRRRPGASTNQIVGHLFGRLPVQHKDSFREYVELELDPLNRFGIIEYREGWYLSTFTNPFAELTASLNESALVDAFSLLSISYAGTCERRFAKEMAIFIADDARDEGDRMHLYFCFLDVLGAKWPDNTVDNGLAVDLDWSTINRFLPPELRRTVACTRSTA